MTIFNLVDHIPGVPLPGLDLSLTYYLSGPMRGYPDHNWPAFSHSAKVLRAADIKIVSPHEVNPAAYLDPKVLEAYPINYLKADIIEMLSRTQAIILLKGWPASRGATTELKIALDHEFPVWFYDDFKLISMG